MSSPDGRRGPGLFLPAVPRYSVLDDLTALGYSRDDAARLLAEYQHRTSAAVGVPTYRWGLDSGDVDAIAEQYRWINIEAGETLDQARDRAAGNADRLTAIAARPAGEISDGYRAWAAGSARVWAERATAPQPFTGIEHAQPDDTGNGSTDGRYPTAADLDAVTVARAAVDAVDDSAEDTAGPGVPGSGGGTDADPRDVELSVEGGGWSR